MNANLDERLTLETDLWNALERNEFVLHYQPKVELAIGAIVGSRRCCAGITRRRDDPAGSLHPIAEESSLIVEIGNWVLHEACAQAARGSSRRTRAADRHQRLRRQIHNGLAQIVRAALESSEAAAALPRDRAHGERRDVEHRRRDRGAREPARAGVGISLDDFGTGIRVSAT
jgi:EAL domain-containing protein (putative c-di-GMP-specific phosphodiesterase class I)